MPRARTVLRTFDRLELSLTSYDRATKELTQDTVEVPIVKYGKGDEPETTEEAKAEYLTSANKLYKQNGVERMAIAVEGVKKIKVQYEMPEEKFLFFAERKN